jgi:arginine repressor
MSEWLGKSNITEEDIKTSQPTISRYFPMLTMYYIDDQKMRIVLPLPREKANRFKEAVIKRFGSFGPVKVREAAVEAIDKWIETCLKGE